MSIDNVYVRFYNLTASWVIYSTEFDVAPKADCETDVTEGAFGHCCWRCYRCI